MPGGELPKCGGIAIADPPHELDVWIRPPGLGEILLWVGKAHGLGCL